MRLQLVGLAVTVNHELGAGTLPKLCKTKSLGHLEPHTHTATTFIHMVHADTSHMCDHVNICGMQLVVVKIPSLLEVGSTIVICLAQHTVTTSIPMTYIRRFVIYFGDTL